MAGKVGSLRPAIAAGLVGAALVQLLPDAIVAARDGVWAAGNLAFASGLLGAALLLFRPRPRARRVWRATGWALVAAGVLLVAALDSGSRWPRALHLENDIGVRYREAVVDPETSRVGAGGAIDRARIAGRPLVMVCVTRLRGHFVGYSPDARQDCALASPPAPGP